jgi:uncharacterized protein (DUF169 family)
MDKIGICIPEERPERIEKLAEGERLTHCAMVAKARRGEVFYAEPANFKCGLSRFNLGLQRRVDSFKSSLVKYLISHSHAKDEQTAKIYLESNPPLKEGEKYLIYFPMTKSPFVPDVLICIGTPVEIMEIVHRLTKETGEATQAWMSGVSAVCAEVTAIPLITGRPNLSLGCCGTRRFGELKENELLLGIPLKGRYRGYGLQDD